MRDENLLSNKRTKSLEMEENPHKRLFHEVWMVYMK